MDDKDGKSSRPNYTFRLLKPEDVNDVAALYELVSGSAPAGFLAGRTRVDFEAVLNDPSAAVAVGARFQGVLVAYSICRLATHIPYERNRMLEHIDPLTNRVYIGMGTAVDPAHEGRLLMARLLALRGEILRERGAEHVIGLVAVDNFSSITNLVRAGAILIGFARDETALNYVAYAGNLLSCVDRRIVDSILRCSDLDGQGALFRSGSVVCAMRRESAEERYFEFAPTAIEC